jgi:predicted CoA-binding protein
MASTSLAVIDDFLAQKRIAFVGVSRNAADFSRQLWGELKQRGYELIPVNPDAAEIDGVPCVPAVTAIRPTPDGVLLMVPPQITESVVRECAAAGIRRVWMYRAAGVGAVSEEAVRFCNENDISVVAGECPYMFLKGNGLHAVHGWWRKITGTYPHLSG